MAGDPHVSPSMAIFRPPAGGPTTAASEGSSLHPHKGKIDMEGTIRATLDGGVAVAACTSSTHTVPSGSVTTSPFLIVPSNDSAFFTPRAARASLRVPRARAQVLSARHTRCSVRAFITGCGQGRA